MNGCFDSRTGLYVRGVTRQARHTTWGSMVDHKDKWQHDYWRKGGDMARKAGGHGGIDYFCLYDFVKMVRTGQPPWIDAYDSAAWSSILHCSRLSLDRGGGPVDVPDVTGGKWRNPDWRKDRIV
jgi:hypothetical protein